MSLLGALVIAALWQGALIAALLACALPLLRSAQLRHAAAVAALAAMVLAPLLDLAGGGAGVGAPPAWLELVGRGWLVGAVPRRV